MNTKIKILIAGAIQVNSASILKQERSLVAIEIDCRSKYLHVFGLGDSNKGPEIFLAADKSTLNLKKGKTIEDVTKIRLTEFKDWEVFSINTHRYTINICLINHEYKA